jgi:hypothetical protein
MKNQRLYSFIHDVLKEWNPIGVPEYITDAEYENYIPSLALVIHNKELIEKELVAILEQMGFRSEIIQKKEVQQDVKDIAKRLWKYGFQDSFHSSGH